MLTFTQMKKKAANFCGIYDDAPEMDNIITDINTGVKLFQNAARRYWIRREKKTNLNANQQYYQFPSDMLRIRTVRVKSGSVMVPLTEVFSEEEWDNLNMSQFAATAHPTHFFVKGADEVGLYPTPRQTVPDGLVVSYEPRMVDMAIEDVKITANVTENRATIVDPQGRFKPNMVNDCWLTVTNGSDGNWYKIAKFIDKNNIQVDNGYQGLTENNVPILIGQCPSFPEEYHLAPVHYAAQQFFLLRKDLESAGMYGQLFDKAFAEYRKVYGKKTSGGVINGKGTRMNNSSRVFPGILRG
jgi:hypothetical protein|nr:MAG TPA: hypothetical protein [Caudoviricetes sp.]